MDPDACLTRIVNAIERRDFEEATAALIDLAQWLDNGGARPKRYASTLHYLPTLF